MTPQEKILWFILGVIATLLLINMRKPKQKLYTISTRIFTSLEEAEKQ